MGKGHGMPVIASVGWLMIFEGRINDQVAEIYGTQGEAPISVTRDHLAALRDSISEFLAKIDPPVAL